MKQIKEIILFIIYLPLYVYYLFAQTNNIVREDMRSWIKIIKYSDDLIVSNIIKIFRFPEYRSVLYKRTKKYSFFIQWLYPLQKLLFICTDNKKIGTGLVIQHGFSTEINANSIGCNCQIWQNVTIGVQHSGMKDKPTIGNNCKICTGAIVVGDIRIGDNVTIGAGTVVTKDVPDNSVVYGAPNRIRGL